MRLIDADKFIERCKEIIAEESKYEAGPASWARADDYEDVIDEINEQPTIDAVPVVRCKDCKYFLPEDKGCDLFYSVTTEDDYCSSGERKEKTDEID